jgi:hypothetical protein
MQISTACENLRSYSFLTLSELYIYQIAESIKTDVFWKESLLTLSIFHSFDWLERVKLRRSSVSSNSIKTF